MITEIKNFFDNILNLDDIIALMEVIPTGLKATIIAGVAFSTFIACKRMFIG